MNSAVSKLPKIAHPIVLYDGVCGLCEASVNFIIHHDPAGRFRFASLQSEIGRRLLAEHGLNADVMNTVVLIDESSAHVRSAAAARVLILLGGGFSVMGEVLAVIPEIIRDAVYNWIARNRYRWFGKRDVCRLPTVEVAKRFL
jgi:predicted DCC family thiol-disulfide oxidoreductase YuxK